MGSVRQYISAFSLFLILSILSIAEGSVLAADVPEEQARQATIVIPYTRYDWWLIRWSDNKILCQVFTNHEGWPTADEVYTACGKTTYAEWANTQSCSTKDGNVVPADCVGLYLHLIGSQPNEKTILVDLPPSQVWINLNGCSQTAPENRCSQIPSLLLSGEEPLPNEQITAIYAILDGQSFMCAGATCEIPLQATRMDGATLEFWAESSFGDTSEHFTALIRVIDTGVAASPAEGGYFVDVLSTQWQGKPAASCAQLWDAFPPVGGPSAWLMTPELPELLSTKEPYYYLAGRLIAQKLVDASACTANGLLANGYADECGLQKALPLVEEWQNRFDTRIIEVAQQTGVPAQLMKNLFAQESQFWPGAFKDPYEYGLGQLTEQGAETLLLWNSSFFDQFCPLVLDESACTRGYVYLAEEYRAILRGALAIQAKTDCLDCLAGIDLTNADFSIKLFAETLLANCSQVSRILFNATKQSPGVVSSYEDIWRFTIANYHVGPGCLSYALYTAWSAGAKMDWEHVSTYLTPACQGVISYVDKVSQ